MAISRSRLGSGKSKTIYIRQKLMSRLPCNQEIDLASKSKPECEHRHGLLGGYLLLVSQGLKFLQQCSIEVIVASHHQLRIDGAVLVRGIGGLT